MKKKLFFCIICVCMAVLTGCDSADSGDYATHEIRCELSVFVTDATAVADAEFWVVGSRFNPFAETNLLLTNNDAITVNDAAMTRTRGIFYDYYSVTLQPAEQYTFTFQRGDGSSYVSTVAAVPPVAITSPEEGASISRAEALDIIWTNPAENTLAHIDIFGEYLNGFYEDVADDGAYTITAESITLDEDAPASSVEATMTVKRSRSGTMGAGLPGSIGAGAIDHIGFISTE